MVGDWDDVYKKGQTTFWVLLALYDGKKYMNQIDDFINKATSNHFQIREQSLYRALRRFHGMGLVTLESIPSPRGPDRKCYSLTETGKIVLARFSSLNINPLYEDHTVQLIQSLTQEKS